MIVELLINVLDHPVRWIAGDLGIAAALFAYAAWPSRKGTDQ